MLIIAIDPGAGGGIAILDNDVITAYAYKEDVLVSLIHRYKPLDPEVWMEQVGGYIGTPQPGSRMFNFGSNYGFIRGAFASHDIKISLVHPVKWQNGLHLKRAKQTSKIVWKRELKEFAKVLYPDLKVTLKTSDALLILQYVINLKETT